MSKNISYFKILILILIFLLYANGFYLRENIAGGAESDFNNFTWKGIQAFKTNFLHTIVNYGAIGEGSLPMFHIINAYLNPFAFNPYIFQLSISIVSLFNVLFFSKILRQKYDLSILDSYLYSSIFLILPFFRSSAFWGLTENLGWLFLILSIKFFQEIHKKKRNVFLVCLFSSLALYTRPYLIFFPIFFIISSLFERKYETFKISLTYYFLFSIPGLFLLYLWGGSVYLGIGEQKVNFILEYHHPKFILKNLIISASIFFLYFAPYFVSKFIKEKNLPNIKKVRICIIGLLFLFLLNYLNIFEYLNSYTLGGGAFLKISQIIFKNNYLFIFVAFLGIISLIQFAKISKKNLILILAITFIYCTARYMYQEYFEPLLLIVLLSLLDLGNKSSDLFKENKTIFIFISYFFLYFISSYYYRYYITT